MHTDYNDIRSRIAEAPTWFDSNGTPRYGEFGPEACPDIYTDDVVLVEISCQCCAKKFLVEMHHCHLSHPSLDPMSAAIQAGTIHYGDPPSHEIDDLDMNCFGESMNCVDLRVLQYWRRGTASPWERVPAMEVALPDSDGGRDDG